MTRTTAGNATPSDAGGAESAGPVTLRTLRRFVRDGEKFACLTCYDATTARWLERAGIPLLLVGDTAAETILGLPGTIHAPLDFLLALTAAVKRGAPRTFVMGDMPFMSYQADAAEGVDAGFAPLVARMAAAGIPVVAHLGCRPQQVKLRGGYLSAGRTTAEARELVEAAKVMEDAGAIMLLLEACPNEVSLRIVERSSIPVIGCGAGPACHGQVVVLHDLLGLTDWQPAFARPLARGGADLIATAEQWARRVRTSDLGEHPYRMGDGQSVGP
jgi:3-methyl-2-oxobutanoate hydroxymethyltransferase